MISNIRRQMAGVRARFMPNGQVLGYSIGQFSMPILHAAVLGVANHVGPEFGEPLQVVVQRRSAYSRRRTY